MAALTITATSVVKGSNAQIDNGYLGAAVTAGQMVYFEAATSTFKLADADGASAEIRTPRGVALNGGAIGQPVAVQRLGQVTIGATMTAGLIYILGDVAGGIMPSADAGAGDRVTVVGIAVSTTVLDLIMKGFDVGQ